MGGNGLNMEGETRPIFILHCGSKNGKSREAREEREKENGGGRGRWEEGRRLSEEGEEGEEGSKLSERMMEREDDERKGEGRGNRLSEVLGGKGKMG